MHTSAHIVGGKVFSQPPIVQVLPLKKMRDACNCHHRYTSTMTDKMIIFFPENQKGVESQKSCLFVGDQILIFHHNLQINSLKILQCDFLDFFYLILSVIVEVYLWWKLQASLIFLSGRTCTIGGWLNTFLPHCIYAVNI